MQCEPLEERRFLAATPLANGNPDELLESLEETAPEILALEESEESEAEYQPESEAENSELEAADNADPSAGNTQSSEDDDGIGEDDDDLPGEADDSQGEDDDEEDEDDGEGEQLVSSSGVRKESANVDTGGDDKSDDEAPDLGDSGVGENKLTATASTTSSATDESQPTEDDQADDQSQESTLSQIIERSPAGAEDGQADGAADDQNELPAFATARNLDGGTQDQELAAVDSAESLPKSEQVDGLAVQQNASRQRLALIAAAQQENVDKTESIEDDQIRSEFNFRNQAGALATSFAESRQASAEKALQKAQDKSERSEAKPNNGKGTQKSIDKAAVKTTIAKVAVGFADFIVGSNTSDLEKEPTQWRSKDSAISEDQESKVSFERGARANDSNSIAAYDNADGQDVVKLTAFERAQSVKDASDSTGGADSEEDSRPKRDAAQSNAVDDSSEQPVALSRSISEPDATEEANSRGEKSATTVASKYLSQESIPVGVKSVVAIAKNESPDSRAERTEAKSDQTNPDPARNDGSSSSQVATNRKEQADGAESAGAPMDPSFTSDTTQLGQSSDAVEQPARSVLDEFVADLGRLVATSSESPRTESDAFGLSGIESEETPRADGGVPVLETPGSGGKENAASSDVELERSEVVSALADPKANGISVNSPSPFEDIASNVSLSQLSVDGGAASSESRASTSVEAELSSENKVADDSTPATSGKPQVSLGASSRSSEELSLVDADLGEFGLGQMEGSRKLVSTDLAQPRIITADLDFKPTEDSEQSQLLVPREISRPVDSDTLESAPVLFSEGGERNLVAGPETAETDMEIVAAREMQQVEPEVDLQTPILERSRGASSESPAVVSGASSASPAVVSVASSASPTTVDETDSNELVGPSLRIEDSAVEVNRAALKENAADAMRPTRPVARNVDSDSDQVSLSASVNPEAAIRVSSAEPEIAEVTSEGQSSQQTVPSRLGVEPPPNGLVGELPLLTVELSQRGQSLLDRDEASKPNEDQLVEQQGQFVQGTTPAAGDQPMLSANQGDWYCPLPEEDDAIAGSGNLLASRRETAGPQKPNIQKQVSARLGEKDVKDENDSASSGGESIAMRRLRVLQSRALRQVDEETIASRSVSIQPEHASNLNDGLQLPSLEFSGDDDGQGTDFYELPSLEQLLEEQGTKKVSEESDTKVAGYIAASFLMLAVPTGARKRQVLMSADRAQRVKWGRG
ncbi:MAG: hypothetical protein ACE361_05320 [Aureliella sp.]